MTKPKLVRNRKVVRLNKNSTFVRSIALGVNNSYFKRGIFILEESDGSVEVMYRNCTAKDRFYLLKRAEHLIAREAEGDISVIYE